MPVYERPPFWRVPHQRMDPGDEPRDFGQRRKVTPGTPAGRELVRGDIIAKIDDYDTRDVRHEDAQNLFRNAPQQIKLVVQRGGASAHLYSLPRSPGSFVGRVPTPTFYHEFAEDVDRDGPRDSGAARAPRSPVSFAAAPYRTPSPQQGWRGQESQQSSRGQESQQSWRGPESLPRTPIPPSHGPAGPAGLPYYNSYPHQIEGEYRTLLLTPSSIRTDETFDESIQSQRKALLPLGRFSPTLTPNFPPYFQNRMHWNHVVYSGEDDWSGSPRSYFERHTSAQLSATTMAVNPNFFPNGYQDPMHPEDEVTTNWPYRTTPLVLPGAKVRREPGPTESYLRHHPNPAMRAPPSHDYRDTLMRQKMVHKQFNSPINLYSDQNIANSIRQQTSPLPHKPTLLYDPAKSETFRALQEDGLGGLVQEVPTPATTKVFTAPLNKRPAPIPRPKPEEKPKGKQSTFVNSLHEEHIQQSNSFKRLMYHVLGDTDF